LDDEFVCRRRGTIAVKGKGEMETWYLVVRRDRGPLYHPAVLDERLELAADADERTILTCFLDFHRSALMRTCAGLSDEQLRTRAVPSSNLTLLGLVRHLAGVERWYFQGVIAGRFPGSLYTATDDDDEDFNDLESATGASAFAIWRAEVEESRRITAERPLDHVGRVPIDPAAEAGGSADPSAGREYSLRWVLNHMIDEYARHNGHADLIREAIDGKTGE
jgi:hypothetical protein